MLCRGSRKSSPGCADAAALKDAGMSGGVGLGAEEFGFQGRGSCC